MSEIRETLQQHHASLQHALDTCRTKHGKELLTELERLRPTVQSLLKSEEALYADILRACGERNDTGTASITRIFEGNLKVMAAGVRGFFNQLAAIGNDPKQLDQRTKTMIDVLQSQMALEVKAVLPLHAKVTS